VSRARTEAKAPALRLVLGDQLSDGLSSLADLDPARDVVLMAEVTSEASYVRHHKRKIAFLTGARGSITSSLTTLRIPESSKQRSGARWSDTAANGWWSPSPANGGC
jgi:hypothetical protein